MMRAWCGATPGAESTMSQSGALPTRMACFPNPGIMRGSRSSRYGGDVERVSGTAYLPRKIHHTTTAAKNNTIVTTAPMSSPLCEGGAGGIVVGGEAGGGMRTCPPGAMGDACSGSVMGLPAGDAEDAALAGADANGGAAGGV